MQAKIRRLLEQHCETLPAEIRELADQLSWLDDEESDKVDTDLLSKAIAQVHKIKGSSGSIGFASISSAAATLETVLYDAQKSRVFDAGSRLEIRTRMLSLVDRVAAMQPEDSRLYHADFSQFAPLR